MMYNLRQNKHKIIVSLLFVLGFYHLVMCLFKLNAFNLNAYEIKLFKLVFYRVYHVSYNLLIGFALLYSWCKKYQWIWLYLGIKILYNMITLIKPIREFLHASIIDGFGCGVLVVVILLILSNEKDG